MLLLQVQAWANFLSSFPPLPISVKGLLPWMCMREIKYACSLSRGRAKVQQCKSPSAPLRALMQLLGRWSSSRCSGSDS